MPRKKSVAGKEKIVGDEFVVESILDVKLGYDKDGSVIEKFYIKWEGYSDNENTWEPRRNLNCPILLKKFFKSRFGKLRREAAREEFNLQNGQHVSERDSHIYGVEDAEEIEEAEDASSSTSLIPEGSSSLPLKNVTVEKVPQSFANQKAASPDIFEEAPSAPSPPVVPLPKRRRIISDSESSDIFQSLSSDECVSRASSESTSAFKKPDHQLYGFDKGYQPERILGVTNEFGNGQLMFLVKWKEVIEADLVTSEEASAKCPMLVLDFFEDRLIFEPETDQCSVVVGEQIS